jgi:hypothetical protein
MSWYFDKCDNAGRDIDIEALDNNGYTAMYLACFKGYRGAAGLGSFTTENI